MIDRYVDRTKKVWIIKDMDDSHILNAHRYFAIRRRDMERSNLSLKYTKKYSGKDMLRISLLINALLQEIDKRELLKY